MQHAEVPNELTKMKLPKEDQEPLLKPGDKVIYALIRMHMDDKTRKCFPSIESIRQYAHCRKTYVKEAIERLKRAGLIDIDSTKLPNGKWSNLYEIKKTEFDKSFERFTPEFLQSDLTIHLKEYIMDTQIYMYINGNKGDFSQSNLTLAKNTGWDVSQINKFDKQLIELGIEKQELSGKIDQSGLPIMKKIVNLDTINQAQLWVRAVNNQLNETQLQVDEVNDAVDSLQTKVDDLTQKAAIRDEMIAKQQDEIENLKKLLVANGIGISLQKEYEF